MLLTGIALPYLAHDFPGRLNGVQGWGGTSRIQEKLLFKNNKL